MLPSNGCAHIGSGRRKRPQPDAGVDGGCSAAGELLSVWMTVQPNGYATPVAGFPARGVASRRDSLVQKREIEISS